MFRALLTILFTLPFLIRPAFASTDPQTNTPTVTTSVPSQVVSNDTTPPTVPILYSPTDGTVTSGARPEFVWYQSSDPNGNTLYYTLHLNGIATYLGISNVGNSSTTNYSSRIDYPFVKLTPSTRPPDGTYDWYVTATDLAGNSRSSTSWRLVIDTTAPPLTLTQLNQLSNPAIYLGANFDIDGPKTVSFTFLTDPQIQVQLNLVGTDTITLVGRSDNQGLVTFTTRLDLGLYTATAFAHDGASNTTFLPDFTLTLSQATIPLPGISPLPIPPIIYNFPSELTHLPATLYQITTSTTSALPYPTLLAVAILLLLIFLSKRRPNITLLDYKLLAIKRATIYHSLPNSRLSLHQLTPTNHGRLYIPHLTRYSSITIRVIEASHCTTHILSISKHSYHYTISL